MFFIKLLLFNFAWQNTKIVWIDRIWIWFWNLYYLLGCQCGQALEVLLVAIIVAGSSISAFSAIIVEDACRDIDAALRVFNGWINLANPTCLKKIINKIWKWQNLTAQNLWFSTKFHSKSSKVFLFPKIYYFQKIKNLNFVLGFSSAGHTDVKIAVLIFSAVVILFCCSVIMLKKHFIQKILGCSIFRSKI